MIMIKHIMITTFIIELYNSYQFRNAERYLHHTRHVIFDRIRGPEIGVLGIKFFVVVGLIGYVDRYLVRHVIWIRGPEIGVLGICCCRIDRIRGPVFWL